MCWDRLACPTYRGAGQIHLGSATCAFRDENVRGYSCSSAPSTRRVHYSRSGSRGEGNEVVVCNPDRHQPVARRDDRREPRAVTSGPRGRLVTARRSSRGINDRARCAPASRSRSSTACRSRRSCASTATCASTRRASRATRRSPSRSRCPTTSCAGSAAASATPTSKRNWAS
jgi:hypothetical protein